MPGPLEVVMAHGPAEAGANRGGDGRDFILGLEGAHAEVLMLGKLVKNVASRSDRIAAQEQLAVAALGGRDQAVGPWPHSP